MNPGKEMRQKPKRRQAWWKTQEKVAYLFETLLKPLETAILHDTKQRDIVGKLRQLDVGVIDEAAGAKRVKSFVEVQKRKKKVDIEQFGTWIYKRDTLGAAEFTVISEAGFSASVLEHVKALHSDKIRLGLLHAAEVGLIERFNSTCLGITRILDRWWFASILVQYADDNEIDGIQLNTINNYEEKIFGPASVMDVIRNVEQGVGSIRPGDIKTLNCDVTLSQLSYSGRLLKRVIIVAEKQRQVWEPKTRFFTYDSVYPSRGQQGIAITSEFNIDQDKSGRLVLVILPDPENISGNFARIAGQVELS